MPISMSTRSMTRKALKSAAVLTVAMIVGACGGGSPQARSITLTFIRHGQSEANAAGLINTAEPGPGLTPQGEEEAHQLARGPHDFDGVYASTMVRTQQTAAPMAAELHRQVEVLPGVQEIGAGWFEGKPDSTAASTYLLAPADWLNGDLADSIPGSISGREFNQRFTAAVNKVYDSGHSRPVVFSHLNSIMYWVLMNTGNSKHSLATSHPLPNIGRVVITGNPATGWTLVDWDGIRDFQG